MFSGGLLKIDRFFNGSFGSNEVCAYVLFQWIKISPKRYFVLGFTSLSVLTFHSIVILTKSQRHRS